MRTTKGFLVSRKAVEKLAAHYGSPLLVLSLDEITRNYKILKRYLPRVKVHYAIKANPNADILQVLDRLGSCFDVASDGEIHFLSDMGVEGSRMIYANPVKTKVGLAACRTCGVNRMTFDSSCEIEKIARECPGATVLLRLKIDNPSAHVDLNKKFGASRENALGLMIHAKAAGLDMAGIAFHVGSQTVGAEAYRRALTITKELFDEAGAIGLHLRILDIGGGFPIPRPGVTFNLRKMLKQINDYLEEKFPKTEIWAEPGRYMCGSAVNLITSVIGVTERGGEPWYFLDEGLYGTFSGIIFDQWNFQLINFKDTDETVTATFAGPSCDSLDILFRDIQTPRLEEGDLLLVPSCGAYTSASATTFNGFSRARVVVWEDVKADIEKELFREEKLRPFADLPAAAGLFAESNVFDPSRLRGSSFPSMRASRFYQ